MTGMLSVDAACSRSRVVRIRVASIQSGSASAGTSAASSRSWTPGASASVCSARRSNVLNPRAPAPRRQDDRHAGERDSREPRADREPSRRRAASEADGTQRRSRRDCPETAAWSRSRETKTPTTPVSIASRAIHRARARSSMGRLIVHTAHTIATSVTTRTSDRPNPSTPTMPRSAIDGTRSRWRSNCHLPRRGAN